MKRLRIAVLILLAAVILPSCMTMRLPVPKSEKTALLVVKVNSTKRATMSYFSDYRLTIRGTGKNFLTVSPKFSYKFESDLPPGEYVLTQVTPTTPRNKAKAGGVTTYEIPFVLEAGQITILPFMLDVNLTSSRDPADAGAGVQSYTLRRVTAADRTKILEEIAGFTNYERWTALNIP